MSDLSNAVKKTKAAAKRKPATNHTAEQNKILNSMKEQSARIAISEEERDAAMLEVLQHIAEKEISVNVETKTIAMAVQKAIESIPQPVVNIPPREPRSYRYTVERNRSGDMTGGELHPIKPNQ